jgi:hypothetical protein
MGKVIDLDNYRNERIGKTGRVSWLKRFHFRLTAETMLADVPDEVLLQLASPGEESSTAFFELIIAVLELGPPDGFDLLTGVHKMRVVDIQLLLADQFRFEMMRRIGWLETFAGRATPICDMIRSCDDLQRRCRGQAPVVGSGHPEADTYDALADRDKHACIRRHLAQALEAYAQRLQTSP